MSGLSPGAFLFREASINSIKPAIAELERLYRGLEALFPDGIPGNDPVIVIQPSRSAASLGWLTTHAWESRQGRQVNEISIGAEHLGRPVEQIAAALLHQMVHHFNALRGVPDCSAEGYHRPAFRDLAIAVGLIVERDGRHGWASTRLSPGAERAVYGLNVNEAVFDMFRRRCCPGKRPTRMLKWSCGCTNVRCAVGLRAVCEGCGQRFERAETVDVVRRDHV